MNFWYLSFILYKNVRFISIRLNIAYYNYIFWVFDYTNIFQLYTCTYERYICDRLLCILNIINHRTKIDCYMTTVLKIRELLCMKNITKLNFSFYNSYTILSDFIHRSQVILVITFSIDLYCWPWYILKRYSTGYGFCDGIPIMSKINSIIIVLINYGHPFWRQCRQQRRLRKSYNILIRPHFIYLFMSILNL